MNHEQKLIFGHLRPCSMLGVDQPYKLTFNGCDYVLWQNRNGEIFALENACPHMQCSLSNGWIYQANNSIMCPFHALEFDGEGRLLKDGEPKGEPVARNLELIIKDDLIWSYGGFEPRLSIYKLIYERTKGLRFLGVACNKSLQTNFLSCIKINYDFNHQNGVNRDIFKIHDNPVQTFDKEDYYARVVQTFFREDNTISEILQNPSLLSLPKKIPNELEYTFPSTTLFKAELALGELLQFFILYPETEHQTRTFVLCYGNWQNPIFKVPGLRALIERSRRATAMQVDKSASVLIAWESM